MSHHSTGVNRRTNENKRGFNLKFICFKLIYFNCLTTKITTRVISNAIFFVIIKFYFISFLNNIEKRSKITKAIETFYSVQAFTVGTQKGPSG